MFQVSRVVESAVGTSGAAPVQESKTIAFAAFVFHLCVIQLPLPTVGVCALFLQNWLGCFDRLWHTNQQSHRKSLCTHSTMPGARCHTWHISVGTHRQKQMQPEGGGTNVNIQSFCDETGGMGKQMHQIGMPPRFTFKRTNCSSLRIFFQGVHSQHFCWHCWFTACKYSSDGSTLSLNVTPGKSSRNLAFKHSRQTGRA